MADTKSGSGRARGRGPISKKPTEEPVRPGLNPPQTEIEKKFSSGRGRCNYRRSQIVDPGEVSHMPRVDQREEAVSGISKAMEAVTLKKCYAYDQYTVQEYGPSALKHEVFLGTSGTKINLKTNYFEVSLDEDLHIFQYHVAFKPEIENVRIKYFLIAQLANTVGKVKCFDGGILYLQTRLPKDPMTCLTTRKDDSQVNVTFTFVGEVHANTPQFLQIVNLLFRRAQVALQMKLIRHNFFMPQLGIQVKEHKVEIMPGYTTSILRYDFGNLLVVDTIHKILRVDTVLDVLYFLYKSNKDDFQTKALKELVGQIVMTRYNNKTYRIDDIDFNSTASSTFEKNGEVISFQDYYSKAWTLEITDPDQPLLISRPTEKDLRRGEKQMVRIIPELCVLTGLDDKLRSNYKAMKDLAEHTRLGPPARIKQIQSLLDRVNCSDKVAEVLEPWHINISSTMMSIEGRQLPAEKLLVRDIKGAVTNISYDIKEADWSRGMRNISLLNPVHMDNWMIIYPRQIAKSSSEFSNCLTNVGRQMKMRIAEPIALEISDDRNDSYLQAIRQNLSSDVQMVVCVAPNAKKDRYDAIKKCCCIDNPVPSQVILARTLDKKTSLMSVATKIAIQMNCKMGGEVWGAEIPVQGLMVVGVDTYHDSAQKNQSVGALVASLNKECTRYFSKTEYHPTKDDLMRNLQPLLTGALKKYHSVNGALPRKIILFRDGVGDGQLKTVFNCEIEQVQAALKDSGGQEYSPGFAFIVVKKRINTRLFAVDGNPSPGTVVDHTITKPSWFDFFLVSQSVRQGTVSPTSYNVIYDATGLQPDHIQRLTYKMTHLYFNWQGTIRVPAPCQYAHKLAFLQGQSLHREFSGYLADKLFYL
ncbi:unnamed protein product [Lymnaea stagnalis]|uniref:Uncharacterized protein n=1 Tax=Lymnaea stagnalis TaxID=6523 RepID=A0AAV2HEZ4_LYMST